MPEVVSQARAAANTLHMQPGPDAVWSELLEFEASSYNSGLLTQQPEQLRAPGNVWQNQPEAAASDSDAVGAPPIDQFAALSLLDMNHFPDSLTEGARHGGEDAADSPFAVHAHEGVTAGEAGMQDAGHAAEEAPTDEPFIALDTVNVEYLPRNAFGVEDDVPISYPEVHGSSWSTMGPESPIHYPHVHRSDPAVEDGLVSGQFTDYNPDFWRSTPSPMTRTHTTALGSDASNGSSVMSGGRGQSNSLGQAPDVISGDIPAEWTQPCQHHAEPAVAPASIHVHEGVLKASQHHVPASLCSHAPASCIASVLGWVLLFCICLAFLRLSRF